MLRPALVSGSRSLVPSRALTVASSRMPRAKVEEASSRSHSRARLRDDLRLFPVSHRSRTPGPSEDRAQRQEAREVHHHLPPRPEVSMSRTVDEIAIRKHRPPSAVLDDDQQRAGGTELAEPIGHGPFRPARELARSDEDWDSIAGRFRDELDLPREAAAAAWL